MKIMRFTYFLLSIMLALSISQMGCGSKGSLGGEGDTAAITIVANPTVVPADGRTSATLQISITDATGNPVRRFTSITLSTNIGTFPNGQQEYKTETNDESGSILVSYMASTVPGAAEIICKSGGITQKLVISNEGIGSININASSLVLPADGVSSTTLTATITNSLGMAVADGTPVTFYTNNGTFVNGSRSFTTYTSSQGAGSVTVSLVAGLSSIPAEITCTAGGITQKIIIFFGESAQIVLEAVGDASIQADGQSSLVLSANVFDVGARPVPVGTPVTFSTDNGYFVNGQQSYTVLTSDASGSVKISLMSSKTPGAANVICTAHGVSQKLVIVFKGGSANITLTPESNRLLADGKSSVKITANVTDLVGNAVPRGTPVTFSTTKGTFANANVIPICGSAVSPLPNIPNGQCLYLFNTVTPDDSGTIIVSLISSTSPGRADVTCMVNNVTQQTEVMFIAQEGLRIDLSSDATCAGCTNTSIPADGVSSMVIIATMNDQDTIAPNIQVGTPVTFSTTNGTFPSGTQKYTTYASEESGTISVPLIASKIAGPAVITVSAGGTTNSITVIFTPVNLTGLYGITLGTNLQTIPADGKSSAMLTATIVDSYGTPPPAGTVVTFSTNHGTFGNGQSQISYTLPTASGSIATSLISSNTPATANIICTVGGSSQQVTVLFTGITQPDQMATITLSSEKYTIPADGTSSVVISAQIQDTYGKPAPIGTQVIMSTDNGQFPNGTKQITLVVPNELGIVATPLISSSQPSIAHITCQVSGTTQRMIVEFVTGSDVPPDVVLPATIEVKANPETIPIGGSSTAITATLIGSSAGKPVTKGTIVTFQTTNGTFSNGTTTYTTQTFDDSGVVTVSLMSGAVPGRAEITCSSNNISQRTTVTFEGDNIKIPASLMISTDKPTVSSDNSNPATITAIVLDANNAVLEGVDVAFNATRGQLSFRTVKTDAQGRAQVAFSSGTDKSTIEVTITATVTGIASRSIPLRIEGSKIALTSDKYTLETGSEASVSSKTAVLTITLKDAADKPIVGVEPKDIIIEVKPIGALTLSTKSEKTNYNGEINYDVIASSTSNDKVVVTVKALGEIQTIEYKVGARGTVFGIESLTLNPDSATLSKLIQPAPKEYAMSTNQNIKITVRAPCENVYDCKVIFASTLGGWDGTANNVSSEKSVINGECSAWIKSSLAGVANIEIYYSHDRSVQDTLILSFSAPSSEATQISLQSNLTVIARNDGKATLTATVKNVTDQVVGQAPVSFSIVNPTGGGEKLSPVVVLTNSNGEAQTTLSAGSLSSDSEGLIIMASIIGRPDVKPSTIKIVIGGTAGSITMGRGTVISDPSDHKNTTYMLPISVLVADSNGNSIKGAVVTLSIWPLQYATGVWVGFNGEDCVPGYSYDDVGLPKYQFFENEDINRNLICDNCLPRGNGEDVNTDSDLTPPNSSSGSLPSTVETDQYGVANFNLVYVKASAAWIKAEITATTRVLGTETESKYIFVLPYLVDDAKKCLLPNSPFNN
ncbi:MAG: Ig-like domain-containing protein [Desulfobacterales bacterium]|nr:Ig-like domain-containing protein [Desulfobacterales bacterium]